MQLTFRNWQRSRKLNLPRLRRMVKVLLAEHLQITDADLGIFFIAESEMTRLNENFMHHAGSTDVITFDYACKAGPASGLSDERVSTSRKTKRSSSHPFLANRRDARSALHGEIFVCVDEAIIQARKFRTTWQSEVVRYIIHGILHLQGHDDLKAEARHKMKLAENKLLGRLVKKYDLPRLEKNWSGIAPSESRQHKNR